MIAAVAEAETEVKILLPGWPETTYFYRTADGGLPSDG